MATGISAKRNISAAKPCHVVWPVLVTWYVPQGAGRPFDAPARNRIARARCGTYVGVQCWSATMRSSGRVLQRRSIVRTKLTARASAVSYTHLRAHETRHDLVCRL